MSKAKPYEPVAEEKVVKDEVSAIGSATAEVVHCAKLNVRSAPNAKSPVIATLNAGERVVVNLTVQNDKFYEILASNGKKGYAMKTYLEIID